MWGGDGAGWTRWTGDCLSWELRNWLVTGVDLMIKGLWLYICVEAGVARVARDCCVYGKAPENYKGSTRWLLRCFVTVEVMLLCFLMDLPEENHQLRLRSDRCSKRHVGKRELENHQQAPRPSKHEGI